MQSFLPKQTARCTSHLRPPRVKNQPQKGALAWSHPLVLRKSLSALPRTAKGLLCRRKNNHGDLQAPKRSRELRSSAARHSCCSCPTRCSQGRWQQARVKALGCHPPQAAVTPPCPISLSPGTCIQLGAQAPSRFLALSRDGGSQVKSSST